LRKTIDESKQNIKTRQATKAELEEEVHALEQQLDKYKQKLEDAKAKLEEINGKLDEVRDAARKTQRDLDRALKEIAGWNDEIEKSASDRHAIFRKCRLEEIDLPLAKGSLDKVPLLEVSLPASLDLPLFLPTNTR
jgi:structural maintenance of chromosome 1